MTLEEKAEIVISQLRADRDRLQNIIEQIRAEIEEIETYDGIYIDRAYVLQIIDKYKESEETICK